MSLRVAGVAFVDHDHVGMFQVGSAGPMQRAIDDGPMLRQQLAPVGKKLRVIVLAHGMGFEARPDIDVHAVGILARRCRHARRIAAALREGGSSHQEQTCGTECQARDGHSRPGAISSGRHNSPSCRQLCGFSESVSQRVAARLRLTGSGSEPASLPRLGGPVATAPS